MTYIHEQVPKILIVDDDDSILLLLQGYLQQKEYLVGKKYIVQTCASGQEALQLAERGELNFDLILLDIIMPNDDGFEILGKLKTLIPNKFIPTIMLTASENREHRIRCFELGADDFIQKPVDFIELEIRIKSLLRIKFQNDELEIHAKELEEKEKRIEKINIELKEANLESVYMLSIACEARDRDTGKHILRIKYFTEALAKEYGLSEDKIHELGYSSMTHDIGKVKIPDAILKKPGSLTPDEWKIMRLHTIYGYELLSKQDFFSVARLIAKSHHEKYDGTGYPDGLIGEDIPLEARIVAIVDVFDALVHKRVYKKAWDMDSALTRINSLWGTHFDPTFEAPFNNLHQNGTLDAILEKFREAHEESE